MELQLVTRWLCVRLLLPLASSCTADFAELSPMESAPPSFSSPWVPSARDLQAMNAGHFSAVRLQPLNDIHSSPDGFALPQLLDIALRNNPATQQTWATARARAAAFGEARAAYYPTLTLDSSVTAQQGIRTRGAQSFEETTVGPGLSLSYLLFDFGGRSAAAESARQALFAANWQHNQQIQDLILAVASAYYTLAGAASLVEAAEASLKEAHTSLTAAEERLNAGVGTITDTLQARATYAQSKLDLVGRQGQLQIARGQLATAVGLPANTKLNVSPPTGEPAITQVVADVNQLIETARAQRPDLAAAWAMLQARQAGIRKAVSDRLPTIGLDSTVQYLYVTESNFSTNGWPYTNALSLSYPLFDGWLLRNAELEARADADAARARFHSQEQDVIAQVWNSYHNLITAAQQVEASKELLKSAAGSYSAALATYEAGVGDIVQLLQAQSVLAGARAQEVRAKTGWYVAFAQLTHDTGMLDTTSALGGLRRGGP